MTFCLLWGLLESWGFRAGPGFQVDSFGVSDHDSAFHGAPNRASDYTLASLAAYLTLQDLGERDPTSQARV